MESSPPLLEYAMPVPALRPFRRVLRWMIFVLTIITVLVVMRNTLAEQIVKWKHRQAVSEMLRAQDDCLRFTIPAGRMVFNGTVGSNAPPPAYFQLMQTLGPSFDRENLGFAIGGAVLFMHEVVSPTGVHVLMIVNLHEPLPGESTYMLRCYQSNLGDRKTPTEIDRVSCPLVIDPLPLATVQGFAGQAVADDPSRFTLPLRVNGRSFLIQCAMQADRTIQFQSAEGMIVGTNDPREGAKLFVDRLPNVDDVLDTRYTWLGSPVVVQPKTVSSKQ